MTGMGGLGYRKYIQVAKLSQSDLSSGGLIILYTRIYSALETFATIALYKLTYTIPYHTILTEPQRMQVQTGV